MVAVIRVSSCSMALALGVLVAAPPPAVAADVDRVLAQADVSGGGEPGGEPRREPIPFPTPGDPRRWQRPADKLAPSAEDRRQDADADVDTARDEAAELRRQATELQESLDRAEAQGKRGAKVKEDPAVARRRVEDIEEQISDLQKRARALDDEAATLAEPPPGSDRSELHDEHDDETGAAGVHPAPGQPAGGARARDPLTDDMDDDLEGDDDLDGGMD